MLQRRTDCSDTRRSPLQQTTILNIDNNNNNGFICNAARMLDYTISAKQNSAYNITQIII